MPPYTHPEDARKIREKALEMAVRSVPIGKHMAEIANRAHYFAHYIADLDRNERCEDLQCPYLEPLVHARAARPGI